MNVRETVFISGRENTRIAPPYRMVGSVVKIGGRIN
ncbi:hypothetical protein AOG2_17300 [Geobacter sp. AOG2]|nr:hypothetical protein AOG2_17300 [Geobacter sp. AOG2]